MTDDYQRAVRVALINRLQQGIEETLDPLIGKATSVIYLNVPFHTNIGDALIWLGTQAYLKRKGIRIEYLASHVNASLRAVRRCGSRLILLHGGGNFGDLWPHPHALAERVVANFSHHRIILLAQSAHFQSVDRLQQAEAIFASHPDLHLCLREEASLAYCQRHFSKTPSYLCPDMAWYLGEQKVPRASQKPLLILSRQDREKRIEELATAFPADRCDWVGALMRRCLVAGIDHTLCRIGPFRRWVYDVHAEQSRADGVQLLARYQTLVTDRLHAHILAALMGKQHIVFDNSYGKIRNTYDTWTHVFQEAVFLDDERKIDSTLARLLNM